MGILDKLKKGWEVKKTWGTSKPTTGQERAPMPGTRSRYDRLAAWIKTRYGNRFRDGVPSAEVEAQLENVFKELETQGAFIKHPKIANGFRAYISERKYGDLVRVID
jgi:hypothetical protein